ncbi:MAG: fibronectin type III domain-containing protein [bacterium]
MYHTIRFSITILIISVLLIGCSGGGNDPITPLVKPSQQNLSDGDNLSSTLGIMGSYELRMDVESMTAELIPVRTPEAIGDGFIVSGTSFFTQTPCADCLKLHSMDITSDGYLKLVFSISHPFFKANPLEPPTALNRLDLDVFDLAMVVVPSGATAQTYGLTGVQVNPNVCVNANGYTNELKPVTGSTNPCPYFLVIDNSESSTSDYNLFEMGTQNALFDTYFSGIESRFMLYLTMGYGASATKPTRLDPVYYNPEFNRKAAWKVEVTPPQGDNPPEMGNTWASGDTFSEYNVTVKVYDWQQGATVSTSYPNPANRNHIPAASQVVKVSAEIPGMTSPLDSVTASIGGSGAPNNPLIYKVPIVNKNNLSAGEYYGLVKVTDSRPTASTAGASDSLVHSPDGIQLNYYTMTEYATYQIFTATVVVGVGFFVTNPNGGEFWEIDAPATVAWLSFGTGPTVDIDLSLDSGGSYTVPIASGVPNTGSYTVPTVGSWATDLARIRVSDLTYSDESNSNFRISCAVPNAPTGLNASDGTYTDRVALTWNAVTGADSYNIYRNSISIATGVTGTSYNDYTALPGVVYSYQVAAVNSCGESATRSNANTGYRQGCASGDGNDSCYVAVELDLDDSTTGCIDQLDTDWYHVYSSPSGISSSSTINLTIPSGTVNVYVYGKDSGGGCPGTLLKSQTGAGSGTISLPASILSNIFIKLTGDSGAVNYTLGTHIVPALSNVQVEVYVATTNGASNGTWPMNGPTQLNHAKVVEMMTWANNIWNQFGYNLNWDGGETFMAVQYYNLDNDAEMTTMHYTYGQRSGLGAIKLSIYLVNQLQPGAGNTAYCIVQQYEYNHTDNNVFSVYSPNVWSWQSVVAHEHGHAIGYLEDQYLYLECGCPCGDQSCLAACIGHTPFLHSDPTGCYNGNLMHYDISGWTWNQYEISDNQWRFVNEFHYLYPNNFHWI